MRCQMKNTRLERAHRKSSEGEFLYELRSSYELSPKLSEQILLSAKQHLIREQSLREGQSEVTVIGVEEKSGKVIEKMEKVRVRLTLDNGLEDMEVQRDFGRIALRQQRIQRITEEAIEQGGVLSQEDVSKYLSASLRTIKRDIQEIKKRGIEVVTRGALHSIGRGQTHKVKIVGLYLEGLTYSDLRLRTRHSVGAIKRYLESFTKVTLAQKRGIRQAKEISTVTGLSASVVRQYQALIEESRRDPVKRANLRELIERTSYRREGIKTTSKLSGFEAVPMIGGSL